MSLAPRNAPCPCGSGRKYKKCCGFDRAGERAIEERLEAIKGLALVGYRSPRLLPIGSGYHRWVEAVLAGEVELRPSEAVAALPRDESRRILEMCAELFPDEIAELSAHCEQREVVAALLGGSVCAGVRDRRRRNLLESRAHLSLIEESTVAANDPFEALGMTLEGDWLWDVSDGREAEREIDTIPQWLDDDEYESRWLAALRRTAGRLATDWHRCRLELLVGEVAEQLPLAGFPNASAAIASGCEQFAADESVRVRLAAILLSDLLAREPLDDLRSLLAA